VNLRRRVLGRNRTWDLTDYYIYLSVALSTTELWWRMNHRKSFRILSSLRRNNFLVRPIQHDHGARTLHLLIYVSPIYCDCATAWSSTYGFTCLHRACVSSRASSCGACCCATTCGANAYSARNNLGVWIQAQVVQMWAVIILRNTFIYMRPDLKSRSGPLTRRSVTWIVLPSLYSFLDLQSQKGRFIAKLHLFETE